MNELIIEGVRCFHNIQDVPIKPLTILVGENSTGKTTFLASLRMAWDVCRGKRPIDFNEKPFQLGVYDQIVSYRGGSAGRNKYFMVGSKMNVNTRMRKKISLQLKDEITIVGYFNQISQTNLSKWVLNADPFKLEIEYPGKDESPNISFFSPNGNGYINNKSYLSSAPNIISMFSFLRFIFSEKRSGEEIKKLLELEGEITVADIKIFENIAKAFYQSLGKRPYAFAPIRTCPQRTYEPLKDIRTPEGTHIPMILAELKSTNPKHWEDFRKFIDIFGKNSGLFRDIGIKRFGTKESDPFKIQVKISKYPFNLIDVGYGVSQSLPIIVETVMGEKKSNYLIQQPEVHLHPMAQAELGTFLGWLVKNHQKRFIIETHSDHLLDRIRIEVRKGRYINLRDVSILYFERENGGVNIYPLKLDRHGNLVNVPENYRQFFLDEEKKLLGIE